MLHGAPPPPLPRFSSALPHHPVLLSALLPNCLVCLVSSTKYWIWMQHASVSGSSLLLVSDTFCMQVKARAKVPSLNCDSTTLL
ncbi:hypothetical protein Hypma_009629 [Hypsizygus marmoreus]|uniref:Uncharacterized protein n=1 Tax=Hypsizygus marmoreus TaxID=39966 RepID=A0A369JUA3_HYPMA|nr:hypothetical protein Hypma_009629 [Hypsizygus marmoreus]